MSHNLYKYAVFLLLLLIYILGACGERVNVMDFSHKTAQLKPGFPSLFAVGPIIFHGYIILYGKSML